MAGSFGIKAPKIFDAEPERERCPPELPKPLSVPCLPTLPKFTGVLLALFDSLFPKFLGLFLALLPAELESVIISCPRLLRFFGVGGCCSPFPSSNNSVKLLR